MLDMQLALTDLEDHTNVIHIDVMDGRFVPELSFTPDEVNGWKTKLAKHVHLMVTAPEWWYPKFENPERIYVHVEIPHITKIITDIKAYTSVGLAINPETKVSTLFPHLKKIDSVLIMSVHPGKSGQRFMRSALARIRALRKKSKIEIVVDGGVTPKNIKSILRAGATKVIMGNAIFSADSVASFYDDIKEVLEC
jgi:ribulose-phosphate 3-epimerase